MVLSDEESPAGFTSEEEDTTHISSLVEKHRLRTRANTKVDGAVGGVPEGDVSKETSGGTTDIIAEIKARQKEINGLFDKFDEICPKSKLKSTRMFLLIQKNSKETRVKMAKWKVNFKALLREQEAEHESLSSAEEALVPDAQETFNKVMKMLTEMYDLESNKIEETLITFEAARDAYWEWEEAAKRAERSCEAGSRPLTPVFEGKWKGDEIFKPCYLSEAP